MLYRFFSLFLALRYLRPKRSFLSIITIISVLGVALGVAVLIIVLSVMTGFERELEEKVVGFDAHLVINGPGPIEDWYSVLEKAKKNPEVLGAAPFVQSPVMIKANGTQMVPNIRGIDPELEAEVTDIRKYILPGGTYDLDGDKVLLGVDIAREMGVGVGDKISVFAPGRLDKMMRDLDQMQKEGDKTSAGAVKQMIVPRDLVVTGIFESGRYAYDSNFIIVPLFVGQELCDLGGAVNGLSLRIKDRYKANEVRDQLNDVLRPPLGALTWIDLNRQFFDAIAMERNVMFIIMFFIVIVAAFCIMNTLITVTVQKTREIGIMKALGARFFQIIGVFFMQGVVVGTFGTLSGLSLGIFVVQYRNPFRDFLSSVLGIQVFPASVYQFNEIPAQIVPQDVALICVSAFVICSLAALIPAFFAALLDPVKALRYE